MNINLDLYRIFYVIAKSGSISAAAETLFISQPAITFQIKKLEDQGKAPIIITSPIVRMYFKKLTKDYFKDLIVVSYNEIESDVELQSIGVVTYNDN